MAFDCGDASCPCCHPETAHECDTPGAYKDGEVWHCGECGRVWTSRPAEWFQERLKVRLPIVAGTYGWTTAAPINLASQEEA